jgi:spore germination protein GerM
MTPRQANVLTAIGLAGLLAAVAFTAPRWSGVLRAPTAPVEGEEPGAEIASAAPESASADAARRISVRLYFGAPDRDGLVPEDRDVAFSSDLARQLRIVVDELARGSTSGLLPTLPAGTRVLDVFVHKGGVAYVNLSAEATSGMPGGSREELLAVYSLVDTLVSNFPATSRVQILVDDKAVSSLGGHVDLSRPLPPDMTLLAAVSPSPDPGASPPAEASPAAPASPAAAAAPR